MKLPRAFALASAVSLLAPVALAQEAPKKTPPPAGELKVKTDKLSTPKVKKRFTMQEMVDQARQVTRGYYYAMIEAKWEEAASFMHPDAVEPMRKAVLADIGSKPGPQQADALKSLGVKSFDELRAMSTSKFYVAWAKSPFGKSVRAARDGTFLVRPIVSPPTCFEGKSFCKVEVKLKGKDDKGKKIYSPNTVFVAPHEGRWLLLHKPPAA
jgi:hypothetical protein